MKTTVNNNNIESKNGMSQVVIDLRPEVKHQDGHGREVLADVHFRINVRAYTDNLYTYTQEATEASNKAVTAFDNEVVEMLKAEGWTLRKEKFGVGDCPQLVKGTQFLYCHPQDISGEVNPADIETLEARIKTLTSCKYYTTDNYGDIIVTTSESDEKQLYRDTYADGLGAIWQEYTITKRSNLYKDKAEAEHCVRRRICIANRRVDLNDIGTGSYNMRTPLLQFLMEEYDRLLQAGYIKEATGQNGRTLCRWINKKEEKELTKARREAEKAEKACATTLEPASEIKNGDGREIRDFKTWNGVTVKGEDRKKWAEHFRETISYKVEFGGESTTYRHNAGHVTVSIAYRNDSDEAEDMSYCVSWYEDTPKGAKLRECENGVTIWQAARAMADFHLLADKVGFETIDEILNPCEKPASIEAQQPTSNVKDDYEPGDRVRHNQSGRVATIEAVNVRKEMKAFGEDRKEYRLDFGESVIGPFGIEMNHGEFLAEAITLERSSEITDSRKAAAIVRERQERPGHVNTSWATDFTPDDFQKLTSRYEIADEDRDIVGRRFHTGEGLWTIDVFVSDYAGNEAHALIYILTGEGEVRANVLSLEHLRATLTEAKGWHEVAA